MSRVIAAFAQFFDGAGNPLASGFLKFLVSGTNNTLKNTYSDSSQTLANENPVQLDAEGRCPNAFGQGTYRVVLYNRNPITGLPGDLIASFDPVAAEADSASIGTNFGGWDSNITYQVGSIVTLNGKYYRSITANNYANDPETNPDQWERIGFISYWNQYVTYLENDVSVYNNQIYISLADSNLNNQPDISPAWWEPPGSGTVLINWQESGTTFQPTFAGYDLGAVGNEVGTAYIVDFGQFTLTPASAPTTDYQIANKKYVDDNDALKMQWLGDWTPGTYNTFDVVRDDNWTMIANTSTDERPAPQPSGDAQWLRDLFSPPAFSETSSNETVLYVGQRYNFTPAFIALGMRVWFPTAAAGLEYKIWAVYNPTGSYRIINLYPGDVIDSTDTDKWLEIPFGQIYVENNTLVDIIIILKAPTSLVDFTFEWAYSKSNGDPPAGSIYHQGGSAIDEIRVHEQDSSLVDRTVQLDNIGPGSTIAMDSTGAQWDVLEASKTGDVYSFIVDPGARSDNATSDFTFQYYGSSPISYVYNTNLYAADARIQGYFGNTYDPDNAAYINENGFGLDIELQSVIVSDDWDVVAQPTGTSTAGGGQVLGYWEESEAYFRPITDNVGYLGDSTHNIQGLFLSDNADIVTPTATDITLNSNILFHEGNLSTDDTLSGDSDTVAVAESAIKGYVDNHPGILNTWENSGNDLWPITTTVGNLGGTSNYVNSGYFSSTIRIGSGTLYASLSNSSFLITGGVGNFGTNSANNVNFKVNGVNSWIISTSNQFYPNVANLYDIGLATRRVRTIYSLNALNTSDIRYKRQISENIFGLDFINRLSTYRYKLSEVENDRFRCGLDAQEINSVLENLNLSYDDFCGLHYDEENDRWDIDYNNFIAPLISAIQELSKKVDLLEAQNNTP